MRAPNAHALLITLVYATNKLLFTRVAACNFAASLRARVFFPGGRTRQTRAGFMRVGVAGRNARRPPRLF